MKIEYIIDRILPPATIEHRDNYNISTIIDELTEIEKKLVEAELLKLIVQNNFEKQNLVPDKKDLILEALAYLKSRSALPILYNLLDEHPTSFAKLCISIMIFEINKDEELIEPAIIYCHDISKNIERIYNHHSLIAAISKLKRFKNSKTDDVIKEYFCHPNFMVSNYAKSLFSA